MNIKGIRVAPKGALCSSCRETIQEAPGPRGSSYATIEVYSEGLGEFYRHVIYLCQKCADRSVSAIQRSQGASVIVNDALEGSIRTVIRLRKYLFGRDTE